MRNNKVSMKQWNNLQIDKTTYRLEKEYFQTLHVVRDNIQKYRKN